LHRVNATHQPLRACRTRPQCNQLMTLVNAISRRSACVSPAQKALPRQQISISVPLGTLNPPQPLDRYQKPNTCAKPMSKMRLHLRLSIEGHASHGALNAVQPVPYSRVQPEPQFHRVSQKPERRHCIKPMALSLNLMFTGRHNIWASQIGDQTKPPTEVPAKILPVKQGANSRSGYTSHGFRGMIFSQGAGCQKTKWRRQPASGMPGQSRYGPVIIHHGLSENWQQPPVTRCPVCSIGAIFHRPSHAPIRLNSVLSCGN